MEMLIIWNAIVFFVYGYDKHQSKRRKQRVSEKLMLLFAGLLGGIGALAGMLFFRHKTRKWKFKIWVPVFALFEFAILCYIHI